MDLANLEVLVSGFFSNGLAPSTQGTYTSAKRSYLSFCLQLNLTPIPVSQRTSCLFAAHLANKGLQSSSISAYLSALRHLQIEAGMVPPARCEWPQLQYVLRGIKRTQSTQPQRLRLPITIDIMGRLQATIFSPQVQWSEYDKIMIWAACCTGFFGFMRSGEYTSTKQGSAVAVTDVALDSHTNPSVVRVFLARAKTDPFGKGVDIFLGRTEAPVCPVIALVHYLASRPARPGPLFTWADGSPLSQPQFVRAIRVVLDSSGMEANKYAGHSFRIGAATTAARAGLPAYLIKTLGRWQSEAYLVYIRTPRDTLAHVARQLCHANRNSTPLH